MYTQILLLNNVKLKYRLRFCILQVYKETETTCPQLKSAEYA